MSLCFRLCLAAGFFFVASFAAATNNNYPEGFARPDLEYRRLAKPSDVIGALGNDLFGEQVDNYSGQTSFSVTDIAIPGNSKLQVALVRSNSIQEPDGYASAQKIGDWDIEVPMLEGIFANNSGGWISDGANPNARCSQGTGVPPTITTPAGGSFLPQDYWQGVKLMIPGMPGQDLLRSNANTQNRSAPARWTTKNNWLIECLPTLKNGVAGEGFVAISPDGTKYFFDHLYSKPSNAFRTRIVQTLYSYESGYGAYVCDGFTRVVSNDYEMLNAVDGAGGGGTGGSCHLDGGTSTSTIKAILYRSSYYLVATRVEDRFGNWVSYTYDANNRLSAIGSNDGRSIQLNYGSTHQFPISATANGRTWSYTYDANKLTRVTQPDGKFWNYAQSGILAPGLLPSVTDPDAHAEPCYDYALFGIGTSAQTEPVFTYVVTHPSGAQGEFKFIPRMQGKSNAISCDVLAVVELSLGSKKITGAGLPSSTWSFVYGPENSSTKTKLTNPNGSQVGLPNDCTTMACITTVNTEIANPDGTVHKLTFGTRIDENDGQLLESLLSKSGKLLRKERYQYVSRSDNQAGFSTKVGDNPKYLYDSIKSEYVLPQKKRLIEQDGTVFSKQVNAFDIFARPTDITRSSSLGFSKTELLTYHDNRNNWTIGQLASISDVTSGKIEAFRNFDPTSARITSQLEFGQLAGTYFWNSDGTLASVKDANNNATSFSNYYRGIPQRITHADASFETGVVNDNGWVTAMTDVLNNNNSFAYDLMGRLTAITPPTGDTVAWSSTAITFDKLLADIYGISSGAWKQTISKGNYRKEIYLDTQWRPILTREFDTANIAGTQRFTRQAYDSEGRVIFASYPGSTDVLALGVRTFYDGLGRVTKVEQDSELGVLTTTTQYLLGSKVQVTDPKGNQTTTTYQLLDDPETSMPVIIKSPEGITTTIVRDVFGKPLSTSRHGAQN